MNFNPTYLQSINVHIAIPCYGGMITERALESARQWIDFASYYNINWTMDTLVNESLIPRGRNLLISRFLAQTPNATHIFFLDSDIEWDPWHLATLLTADVDVIGGLYNKKEFPGLFTMTTLPNGKVIDNLREVQSVGAGFLLIKKHVFEKLNEHPAIKVHVDEDYAELNKNLEPGSYLEMTFRNYFDTSVRNNLYYSEYDTFCDNWRQLGGTIWIDTRVHVKHTGLISYSKDTEEYLYYMSGRLLLEDLEHVGNKLVYKNGIEPDLMVSENKYQINTTLIDENGKEININI